MAKLISAYLILFYGLVFLHHTIKVVRTLYWHNTMSWQYYNMGVLCYCNIMLSGYYVVVLSCYCNVMLLGHYVVVLLCYQGITLLQHHNRVCFTYTLIINHITIFIKQRIQLYYNNLHTIIWYRLICNICKSGCHSTIQHKTFNIEYLNFGK